MKKLFYFITTLLFMVACNADKSTETVNHSLRFHDGHFRIAQFTDMHWGWNDGVKDSIAEMIQTAIKSESPDLCIFTGDIVTNGDQKKGWQELVSIMEKTGVPYVVLLGNHDAECLDPDLFPHQADSIYAFLRGNAPHHIGQEGLAEIHGHGNGYLEIKGENTDSTRAVVWYFDSGDYYPNKLISDYDCIHRNQIDWYAKESDRLTAKNGGQPIPSLAYFHICTPEYDIVANDEIERFGSFNEVTCPAKVNSGFLAAVLEQGDIMGTFVGHDHTNDYIGLWKGIALAYGRQSGVDVHHGKLDMGCRIVELTEGSRTFDTWIWTMKGKDFTYYFPGGYTSDEEEKINFKPAQDIDEKTLEQGLDYVYYEGSTDERTLGTILRPKNRRSEGVIANFDITKAPVEDHFGYIFDGYLNVSDRGVYTFTLNSDDDSRLYIDDELVIENSKNSEDLRYKTGLEKGMHKIKIEYFENYMGQNLDIFITTREKRRQPLADTMLFHSKK